MGDVHVPFGDDISKTAALLLDAAEKSKDYDQSVVFVDHFTDTFVVPEEVAEAAGLDPSDPDEEFGKEVKQAQKDAETKAGQSGELLSVSGYDVEGGAAAANQKKAQAESEEAPAQPAAKKAPAKKAAAKKTAAKKS